MDIHYQWWDWGHGNLTQYLISIYVKLKDLIAFAGAGTLPRKQYRRMRRLWRCVLRFIAFTFLLFSLDELSLQSNSGFGNYHLPYDDLQHRGTNDSVKVVILSLVTWVIVTTRISLITVIGFVNITVLSNLTSTRFLSSFVPSRTL